MDYDPDVPVQITWASWQHARAAGPWGILLWEQIRCTRLEVELALHTIALACDMQRLLPYNLAVPALLPKLPALPLRRIYSFLNEGAPCARAIGYPHEAPLGLPGNAYRHLASGDGQRRLLAWLRQELEREALCLHYLGELPKRASAVVKAVQLSLERAAVSGVPLV